MTQSAVGSADLQSAAIARSEPGALPQAITARAFSPQAYRWFSALPDRGSAREPIIDSHSIDITLAAKYPCKLTMRYLAVFLEVAGVGAPVETRM